MQLSYEWAQISNLKILINKMKRNTINFSERIYNIASQKHDIKWLSVDYYIGN